MIEQPATRAPCCPEQAVVEQLLSQLAFSPQQTANIARCSLQLQHLLRQQHTPLAAERWLAAFPLDKCSGQQLMALSEALLRCPCPATAFSLLQEKLGQSDWQPQLKSPLYYLAGCLLRGAQTSLTSRIASFPPLQTLSLTVAKHAIAQFGRQFVIAEDIEQAIARAARQPRYHFSFDMLGEAARSEGEAQYYYEQYLAAINALRQHRIDQPAISIKLSALHPRYQPRQRDRVMQQLLPRLRSLAETAKQRGVALTIDAEEHYRLALSLTLVEALLATPSLAGWQGFGVAVQAYQLDAQHTVTRLEQLAQQFAIPIAVRLVKGAYWDWEIKRAQQLGLDHYPVFTRKQATDISYLALAQRLIGSEYLRPQFATHNPQTVASVLALLASQPCRKSAKTVEFQRLQGMAKALYDGIRVPCRVYAPVGEQRALLAYLVRRLIENGANNACLHWLSHSQQPLVDEFSALQSAPPPMPCGRQLYSHLNACSAPRMNALGVDIDNDSDAALISAALQATLQADNTNNDTPKPADEHPLISSNPANGTTLAILSSDSHLSAQHKLDQVANGLRQWQHSKPAQRAAKLELLAQLLEQHIMLLAALCIAEAGKSYRDSIADVREAIDFCRYYANQAGALSQQQHGRGVAVCISPWNFPCAIFVGQVSAALAAGNTVVAKAAEQTSVVASELVALFYQAGFSQEQLQLVLGDGAVLGPTLLQHPATQVVLFTGSNDSAQRIAGVLAMREDSVPLIAETGGQNAMIADATVLPEQLIDDVLQSSFYAAGQRCSALRVLYLPVEIADSLIAKISAAMDCLVIGDPSNPATDIGPIIDAAAQRRLSAHCQYLARLNGAALIKQCNLNPDLNGTFFAPRLYEVQQLADLPSEVFGPILHIIRYRPEHIDSVITDINRSGYGLTFGVHSRRNHFVEQLSHAINAGNIYINRDMVGAVVGCQPFGGCGLSGTGPKAGGAQYLARLTRIAPTPCTAKLPDWLEQPLPVTHEARLSPSWATQRLAFRQQRIRRWLHALNQRLPCEWWDYLQQQVDTQCHWLQQLEQPLPSVTGEHNQHRWRPRGRCLLVVEKKQLQRHLLHIAAALLTGNTLLICSPAPMPGVLALALQKWQQVNPDHAVFQCINDPQPRTLATRPDIKAALCASLVTAKPIERAALARKDGLLPVITEDHPQQLAARLVIEQTVCSNTAAIGGNLALIQQS